jgi:heme exporter protein D
VDALTNYLAMGGYAAYVWPAYGFAALVMGGLAVASRRALARRAAELAALEGGTRAQRRAARGGAAETAA